MVGGYLPGHQRRGPRVEPGCTGDGTSVRSTSTAFSKIAGRVKETPSNAGAELTSTSEAYPRLSNLLAAKQNKQHTPEIVATVRQSMLEEREKERERSLC